MTSAYPGLAYPGATYPGDTTNGGGGGGSPVTTITDTFTRANSTSTLGSTESPVLPWTADNGTWGISSNQAYVVTQAGFDSRATIPVGQVNQDVSASITNAGEDIGVLASYVDSGNYYYAQVDSGGTVRVVRKQAGSENNLATGLTGWSSGSILRLVTNDSGSGTQVTAYIGAVQKYTGLDTTSGRPAGTRAGLRSGAGVSPGAARWDNFSVVYTEPPVPPPLAPPAGIPLTVRLRGGNAGAGSDRQVTKDVHDLVFTTTAPGGFGTCTVALTRPLIFRPNEFERFGRLYVYDGRSGEVMFEGRLDDPGRTAGADGEVWSLTAVGGSAHTTDSTIPLIYVDRQLEAWEHYVLGSGDVKNGNFETRIGDDAADQDVLYQQVPNGTAVVTGNRLRGIYWRLRETGQKLASINFSWDAGLTTNSYQIRAVTTDGTVARNYDFTTSGGTASRRVIGTNWTAGQDTISVEIYYAGGGGTVTIETVWITVQGLVIAATRYDKSGTELVTGASYNTTDTVLASEVVADLLGRLLPQADGALANIATTGFEIEQLAYPDGVTAQQVLTDLATFEPGYYWAMWASNPVNDKWRFEYQPWPTIVRYETTTADGFEAPASGGELFNRVRVRWRRPNGRTTTTVRTSTVPALDNAIGGPLIRTALIDAGDNTVATAAGANRVGDQFLAEHKYPGNAGRLRVAHPIYDADRHQMVMPWQIRAGSLIRVRGVLPTPDFLNTDDRDASTVFRIASTSFSQSDGAVELDLDAYAPDVARALATLEQRFATRRRR